MDVDEVAVPLAVTVKASEALEDSIVVFEMDVGANTEAGEVPTLREVPTLVEVSTLIEVPTLVEVPAWEEVERVRDGF